MGLDTRNLPQDQKSEVEAILLPSLIHLADLLRKVQTPPQGSCIFPSACPGCSGSSGGLQPAVGLGTFRLSRAPRSVAAVTIVRSI